MKRLILLLMLVAMPIYAKTVDISSGGGTKTGNYTVTAGCRGLTLIFSSDYTGTVAGKTFTGATDSSYTVPMQAGDTLAAVAVVVTTGTVRIIEVR
jgi:hypothetical protein